MREIKFRGRNIEGEWLQGDLINGKINNTPTAFIFPADAPNSYDRYSVNPNTIGQFTGLRDKNDTEIYEGDIIGCHNPNIKHLIFYNERQARFMAALNGDIDNDFVCVCGLDDSRWNASKEVIGNIHDNPELLKSL